MKSLKNILFVSTVLLCMFIIGISIFTKAAGDEVLTRVCFLLIWAIAVIGYHYMSYVYYDENILKGLKKKLMILLCVIALGFNFFIIYQTFFPLFDRIMAFYNLQLNFGLFIDIAVFIFGLLGVVEIVLLRHRIKSVTQKKMNKHEIDDIGNANF